MVEPEADFESDVEELNEAVEIALNELTRVKAYVLTPEELTALKTAQYSLRVIHPEFDAVKNGAKMEMVLDE